jgi:hypothetical protein
MCMDSVGAFMNSRGISGCIVLGTWDISMRMEMRAVHE